MIIFVYYVNVVQDIDDAFNKTNVFYYLVLFSLLYNDNNDLFVGRFHASQ